MLLGKETFACVNKACKNRLVLKIFYVTCVFILNSKSTRDFPVVIKRGCQGHRPPPRYYCAES